MTLKAIGEMSSLEKVMNDLINRDYKDSTRANSPLKKSDDAIIIDTSRLGISKVIDKIVNIVKHKGH